jgi:hypothetical protein
MSKIRKSLVGLVSIILCISLLLISLSTGLKLSLSTPNKMESLIDNTNLYGAFINKSVSEADSALGGEQTGTIESELKTAATTALTRAEFDGYVNQLVSANYNWLSGKTKTPLFKINLISNKDKFATQVGTYVQRQLNSLPTCSTAQALQLNNANVLILTCRPSILSPSFAAEQITDEIKTSSVFLGNPVVTPTSLNANNNNDTRPYYKKLHNASKLYRLGINLPYINLLVAIICMGIIWFASQKKKKAIRSIGYIFALAGIVLIVSKISSVSIDRHLDKKLISSHNLGFLHAPILQFANSVGHNISKTNLIFGLSYILISLILILSRRRIQRIKTKQIKQPLEVADTDQAENTIDLSSRRVLSNATHAIRPGSSSNVLTPRAPTAPPMPIKPPKRRNLIQ